MNLNNKKGFTLVELLIVIAIIAILAAVAIPQFTRMVNRARDSAIATEMRNIWTRATVMDAFRYPTATIRCSNIEGAPGIDPVIADSEIAGFCEGLRANSPAPLTYHNDNTAFCFKARLNIPMGNYTHWCVDSTGFNDRINPGDTADIEWDAAQEDWTAGTVAACYELEPAANHPGYNNFSCAVRRFP